MLKAVTFTGADNNTNIDNINNIKNTNPLVEFAVLHNITSQGSSKFPDFWWMTQFVNININRAIHLCGKTCYEFINGNLPKNYFIAYCNRSNFSRIQLNFNNKFIDFSHRQKIYTLSQQYHLVLQYNKGNKFLCDSLIDMGAEVDFLFDSSGGRGILNKQWPEPIKGHYCGYAGGLNPDNVLEEVKKISEICPYDYWIDMESGVRTNDRFDLDKVNQICQILKDNGFLNG